MQATAILNDRWARLDDATRFRVFVELNLVDLVFYDEVGNLHCNGTDLQCVALAAAFAAVVENQRTPADDSNST